MESGHLTRHKQVDLSAMLFVKGQRLINLRAGDVGEAARDQAVHSFSVLEKPDDIMHGDPSSFDDRMAAAHTLFAGEVAIAESGWFSVHAPILVEKLLRGETFRLK